MQTRFRLEISKISIKIILVIFIGLLVVFYGILGLMINNQIDDLIISDTGFENAKDFYTSISIKNGNYVIIIDRTGLFGKPGDVLDPTNVSLLITIFHPTSSSLDSNIPTEVYIKPKTRVFIPLKVLFEETTISFTFQTQHQISGGLILNSAVPKINQIHDLKIYSTYNLFAIAILSGTTLLLIIKDIYHQYRAKVRSKTS